MTKQEFQDRYHAFRTPDKADAERERDKANAEGIEGDTSVIIRFPPFGWGLMLGAAARSLIALFPELVNDQ